MLVLATTVSCVTDSGMQCDLESTERVAASSVSPLQVELVQVVSISTIHR